MFVRTSSSHAAIALLTVALVAGSIPVAAGEDPTTEPTVDEAFLAEAYERLEERLGERLVDVGLAETPTRHLVVLVDGPALDRAPDLHPEMDTRVVPVDGAKEITHGPLVPYMLRTSVDVPSTIRPGAWMIEPAPCTLSHVVEDASGGLYVLTAGHCTNTAAERADDLGRPVEIVTDAGPTGHETLEIGTVLDFEDSGVGADYALVDVHAHLEDQVEPSMAGWQGPTGLADELPPGTVHHYGFGSAATWTSDATRCRTGVTGGPLGYIGARSYGFTGLLAFGDSGSPSQNAEGEALGINTHLSFNATTALGTRATHALDALETRTGLELSLVDGDPQAPVCQLV